MAAFPASRRYNAERRTRLRWNNMDVLMELSRIVISETSAQQVIFLREKEGERTFPIVIGINEALAIDRRLKGIDMPRPMTHDLLARVIEALGGSLEKIVINDLRDRTFIATLVIRRGGGIVQVDARPSDAIALGVAFETPIYVAEHVLEEVLSESFDIAEQKENLQARREELVEQVRQLRRHLQDPNFRAQAGPDRTRALKRQLQEMEGELGAIEEILRHME
jgi:uncharacterized protein